MLSILDLHPEFITKNGEREFAVLPYGEFIALQQLLEDMEDIIDIRSARNENEGQPNLSLEEAKKVLGLR